MSGGSFEVTRKRGFFGQIFKWLFILFNLVMFAMFLAMIGSVDEVASNAVTDAERAGAAIGGSLALGSLMVMWAVGSAILGILVVVTRGKLQFRHDAPSINVNVVNQLGTGPKLAAAGRTASRQPRHLPRYDDEDEDAMDDFYVPARREPRFRERPSGY